MGHSDTTYTEAEFVSVVSEVEGLKAQLAELTAAATTSEIDAGVAEAVAGVEAQVADLQTRLDSAVLEAQAAKDEAAGAVTYMAEICLCGRCRRWARRP